MKKKSVIFILIGVVIIAIIFLKPGQWFSNDGGDKKGTAQPGTGGAPPVGINAVVLKPEFLENKIYATGTILANEEVELRSEIAGRITGIHFTEDAIVSKGQLLVKINDSDFQAQLKKLKLQEKLASEDENRKRQLLEVRGISQEEFDRAQNLVSTLNADIQYIEAQIRKTEIRAPFDGVIGLRHVSEGGYISNTSLIANMQDLDPVKVEFNVPEKYADLVKKGSKISFTITGREKKYTGTVYAASTKIDLNTRTLTIRALAPNPDRALTPGAFVKIEFALENIKDALLVPSEAIVPELGGQKVFVVRNDTARTVKVETGIRTEKEVQVTKGLQPNDTVITTGILQIREKSPVKVKQVVTKDQLEVETKTN